ncbi:AAA family ATPase [Xanthomonas phage JGB6]|nr:AAA family ATPase [Xanthomonas phage JGB6]
MTTTPATTAFPPIKVFYDRTKAQEDLRHFDPDINIDFMRQAGLYAYYAALLVQAEEQLDKYEHNIERMEAKLDQTIRDDAVTSGSKVTEGQITKRVARNAMLIELKRRYIEAKAQVGYLKSTCIAFAQRKDMLIQLGMLRRKEEEASGMSVRTSTKANHEARMSRLRDLETPEE